MSDSISLLRSLTRLKNRRIHLGITGSVASFKSAELLRHLLACGIHVSVTLTEAAQHFVTPLLFEALGANPVYTDMFRKDEGIFSHLEPGQSANALFIVPASASTLSRMAQGDASNLLAAQALAFDGPTLIAPAMNPRMWKHPATQANLQTLCQRSVSLVAPEGGELACGETGQGRLASMPILFASALRALADQDMKNQTVLVTCGPTREPWDGVRFWSNPSTGTMGACLALAAWIRGAQVIAIAGPGAEQLIPPLPQLDCIPVGTAREMFHACQAHWELCTMGIFSSAVADFSPVPYGKTKFKKEKAQEGFSVSFVPNPDILKSLAQEKGTKKILGFAAETAESPEHLAELAKAKLARKGATVLAANNVAEKGSGFATSTNSMLVVDQKGREELWPLQSKADVAWDLCSWLLHF